MNLIKQKLDSYKSSYSNRGDFKFDFNNLASAEKYNIQLICFSGIGGSSVYNRFDKIYVAKVIEDKFRNKENVTFKAGSEETLELSDFTITKEQISLF